MFLLTVPVIVWSNSIFEMEKGECNHEGDIVSSFNVRFEMDVAKAKSYWNDFMEDENDNDISGYGLFRKKDLLETEMTLMPELSNEPLKLFAHFRQLGEYAVLHLYAKDKSGTFIAEDSHPNTFKNIQRLAQRFVKYTVPLHCENLLDEAQDKLKDYQKQRERKQDDIEDMEEDITEHQEEIQDLKKEIQQGKISLEGIDQNIESAKADLEAKESLYDSIKKELAEIK